MASRVWGMPGLSQVVGRFGRLPLHQAAVAVRQSAACQGWQLPLGPSDGNAVCPEPVAPCGSGGHSAPLL